MNFYLCSSSREYLQPDTYLNITYVIFSVHNKCENYQRSLQDRSAGKVNCFQAEDLRSHMVEGENRLRQAVLWPPHGMMWHSHTCTHTKINKNKIQFKVLPAGLESCSTVSRAAAGGLRFRSQHPCQRAQPSETLVLGHLVLSSGYHVLTSHAHGTHMHPGLEV